VYKLFILEKAMKELSQLSDKDYQRAKKKILSLQEEPRPRGCKKLKGREGWRLRCGQYRIVYEIDDLEKRLTILHIGHRRDVYRI
jgi:mRNA interferase RelE/StbE